MGIRFVESVRGRGMYYGEVPVGREDAYNHEIVTRAVSLVFNKDALVQPQDDTFSHYDTSEVESVACAAAAIMDQAEVLPKDCEGLLQAH